MNERIDIGTVNDCKNLSESYGEICVRCNKCGRFDQEKQIEEMAKDICHLNVSCDECTMLAKQMGQSKERYCKAMQYAKRAYEKGYRKQSEWISVDDRLPTECENVLCFEKGKVYVAFMENAACSTIWWDWVDYDRDDTWTERTPTHWMPLPEPPKMKGGE